MNKMPMLLLMWQKPKKAILQQKVHPHLSKQQSFVLRLILIQKHLNSFQKISINHLDVMIQEILPVTEIFQMYPIQNQAPKDH